MMINKFKARKEDFYEDYRSYWWYSLWKSTVSAYLKQKELLSLMVML